MATKLLESVVPARRFSTIEKIGTRECRRYWLESILRHPESIKDGRKRILYHLLIPYLITEKKMKPDDVFKELIDWLERSGADSRKYRSWLISNIKLTARKQIRPMSYSRFIEQYPALERYLCLFYGR
jgi:intein/homing endonuclease